MSEQWRAARDWTPPSAALIDVWRLDLVATDDDWELLSTDEIERVQRIVIQEKRDQRASSRARLRRILARYVGADPSDLRFDYGEHGKPTLANHEGLGFNLTHSEKMGLVAVSADIRLGIDVEHSRERRDFKGLAERYFSRDECAALMALPEREHPAAFYRAWTRKEAYLKALGTGLSFPSNAFTVEYTEAGVGRVKATDMPGDDPKAWRLADIRVSPEFAAALCFEGSARPMRWWALDGG